MILLLMLFFQESQLKITFVGNNGVALHDGETTLLVDLPYQSGAYGLMKYDPATIPASGNVVCVITHEHEDHFDPEIFKTKNCQILGPAEVTVGLDPARVISRDPTNEVGAFSITGINTPHGKVVHLSYLIEWRGHKLYFTGDTEDPQMLVDQSALSIAFITPWLACVIEQRKDTVKAQRKIMIHHLGDGSDEACLGLEIWKQGDEIILEGK